MVRRDDFVVGLGIAAILAVVALAIFGALDMDDTKTNLPPEPPAVYQHPEGP